MQIARGFITLHICWLAGERTYSSEEDHYVPLDLSVLSLEKPSLVLVLIVYNNAIWALQ